MAFAETQAPVTVYLLADHLDAALAAGEDLLAEGRAWKSLFADQRSATASAAGSLTHEREIIERLRVAELHLVTRLLAARRHAEALAMLDGTFAPLATLFAGGTAILSDAAPDLADTTDEDFDNADTLIAFARSRALITRECGSLNTAMTGDIAEQFHIAGRIPLNPTLDLVATFLETLDSRYDLYPDDDNATDDFVADAVADDSEASQHAANTIADDDASAEPATGAESVEDGTTATVPPTELPKPRSLMAALEATQPDLPRLH